MTIEIHDLQSCMDVDLGLVERAVIVALREDSAGEMDSTSRNAGIVEFEPIEISVSIVDDAMIHEINREHLNHDYPTDVISFDYREEEEDTGISGEVILSAETAHRVASKKKHTPIAELILYVVHGVLHIKGYDDKTREEASVMWAAQNRIMTRLGFTEEFRP